MDRTDRLRAIIVGTGFGVITHLRALRAAGFDVLALVGRDSAKTRERAENAGIPLALTSLSEALALPGCDVVAVATPPHTHGDICLQAIHAGKHVVCEKPFARDSEQAMAMLGAARERGVVHYVGTEHRWDTGQALVGHALADGVIGDPKVVTMLLQVPLLYSADTEVPDWWGDAEQGGGWLGAYGSHQIDFSIDLFGEFAGVSASLAVLSQHDWSADDSFSIHFRTVSGVTGILQSSCATLGTPLIHFRIAGSKGLLEMSGDRVFISDMDGRREIEALEELHNDAPIPADPALMNTAYEKLHAGGSDLSPYTRLYRCFRAEILQESNPDPITPATFVEGLAMQKVIDAVKVSSDRNGAWIDIA